MFDLKQVGRNTYYFEMPSKIGVYDLGDGEVCLIDSGNDEKIAARAMKKINERRWRVKAIYNTHCHADHTGGNHRIQEETGCEIFCPDIDAAAVNVPILNPVLLWGAYPIKELDHKFYLAQKSNVKPLSSTVMPKGLEVLPLNGHSMGMVGYKTDDDVYFVADSVCSSEVIEKYRLTYLIDVENYLRTLHKLEKYEGKICIPSHCEPTNNINQLIDVNRRAVEHILEDLEKYCTIPRLTDDVIDHLFNINELKFNPMQYALIGSTVKSYLAYLQRHNRMEIECNSNKIYWHSAV